MTKKLIFAVTLMMAMAFSVFAADVTGKWTAQVPGRGGNMQETTFTLKQSGSDLTGSMTGFQGMEIPLTEGKVTGDSIVFTTVRERNGNTIKQVYNGTVSGDEIKFKTEGRGGPQEFTAKKAK